jgi:hypothetical protein
VSHSPCGTVEAACVCSLPLRHDGPHVCDCGGSWHFDNDGEFVADTLPNLSPLALLTTDPLMVALACAPPITGTRGGIRYKRPDESEVIA